MQSMLQNIYVLDSFIKSIVTEHLSESIYNTFDETWQHTAQKRETCLTPSRLEINISGEINKDKVSCNVSSHNCTGSNVDTSLQTSTDRDYKLKQEISKLEQELAALQQQEMDNIKNCNEHLDLLNEQKVLLKTQTDDLKTVESRLNLAETHLELLRKSLSEKSKICEQHEQTIGDLSKENQDLQKTIQDVQHQNSYLNEQLNKKKTVELQICFQRTQLLTHVAQEIEEKVKTKCKLTADIAVNCITLDSQTDLKRGKPTIVLCINASRLGRDVAMALSGIQCSPEVAVIVLHHKAKHALPNQSSERVLTSPEYKQLGGIFDMAFLPEQGIYHCDMNEIALKGIFEFLKYRIFHKELLQ